MSHINERWVAIDGSVYTEEAYLRQVAAGEVKYRPGIAFNVGQMVAEHMVQTHNAWLEQMSVELSTEELVALAIGGHVVLDGNIVAGPAPASAVDLPPPHDSLGEAQRAAGMSIGVRDGATGMRVYVNGVLLHDSQAAAPGMSSVMQSQGSSLRPVEIGQAVVAAAPKPCCGCRKG